MRLLLGVLLGLVGCGSITVVPQTSSDGATGGAGTDATVEVIADRPPTVGTGGAGGTGGSPVDAGRDVASSGGTSGGSGGSGGTAGQPGSGGSGGMVATGSGGTGGIPLIPCNTRFNFENGATYGAKLGTDGSMAFKAVGTGLHTACGLGALQITAAFTGTMGATAKGTVVIDLPAPENMAGKTISLKASVDPVAKPPLTGPSLTLSLVTPMGFVDLLPSIRNIPGGYTSTMSYPIPSNAGIMSVSSIVIVGTDVEGYVGKLYVDELDVK